MKCVLVAIMLLHVGVPYSTAADLGLQQGPDELTEKVDELFAEWDVRGSPGGTVILTRGGDVVLTRSYGLADIEHGIPVTATTRFELASVSKPFTAFAVVILPDGVTMLNALTLDTPLTPVATNVPGLTVTDEPFTFPLINKTIPAGAPLGDYEVVAAFFDPAGPIIGRADAFLEASSTFTIQ